MKQIGKKTKKKNLLQKNNLRYTGGIDRPLFFAMIYSSIKIKHNPPLYDVFSIKEK